MGSSPCSSLLVTYSSRLVCRSVVLTSASRSSVSSLKAVQWIGVCQWLLPVRETHSFRNTASQPAMSVWFSFKAAWYT